VAEDEEVEGELGLQILRALSILKFLEEFLVVFMGFFLQSPICSCCNRGVEGKVVEKGEGFFGVLDCGGEREAESWWMGRWSDLLCPGPLFYTLFSIFGEREADGGRGVFLSSLSSHSTWAVFPLFSFLCLFSLCSANLLLKLVSSLSGGSNWFELILLFP
jgi:hypothetical protein